MRRSIKLLPAILLAFSLLLLTAGPVAYATEEMPTVKVAMSEDESIIVERILYTALKRSGYQMVTKTAGMRTTVNDVNYGDAVIVPAQTIGLDEEYTNLVRVPVPISYVETNVYAREEDQYQFTSWSDLTGLRLSHCNKNLYITRNVPRANASEVVTLNEYEELWESLLANETDVSVIPNLTGNVRIVPEGVTMAGVIEREPRYTYVNKDYPELVELLTDAYQQMTDDGTMELIHSSNQSGDKQLVLHISSYSTQTEWERSLIAAVRESLETIPDLEYQNLNLNARQVLNKANINSVIANTIRTNYIERNPDLIIVSDNDALEFVLNNYYMLFPTTPVVFCGVNDFDSSMLYGFEEYITGATESISFAETAREILRLYPETERIYIINDYTTSGLKWTDDIKKSLDDLDLPVEFVFNEDKPFADVLEEIHGFDSRTQVLLGTYFTDSGGVFYSEQEVQSLICEASQTPVFCMVDSFSGYGTLGGCVSSGEEQGKAAGIIADSILAGTPVSEIPVITDSESLNRWQFDYAVAKQFGIKTADLPAGHTVLNLEARIWETNPLMFGFMLTVTVLFLIIIIGLAFFLRLMRKKNRSLTEMQSHLHSAEEMIQKDNDLRRVIESLPVSVLIVDIDTHMPEYGNQAFLTETGLGSFEEAAELNLSPVVEMAFSLWQDKSARFDYGSFREPDSEICRKISAEKLVFRNKDCLVLISEDITAHIKEKEMLSRAAQMEKEANMLKSKFLANMSHEIRTPMNGIIGMTELLMVERLARRPLQYVKDIKSSAESLLGIINDILDLSKITEGQLNIMPVDVDISLLLKNIVSMMSFSARSKGLNFVDNIRISSPEYVRVDDVRLNQIVVNLISNAIKFTREGYVKLTAKIEDGNIVLEIKDTGIGIKEEELPLIFVAFEQADKFRNRAIKGTGLGLSISRNLAELMGGKVWVESEYGSGSTFYVTIPYVPGDAAAVEKAEAEFEYLSAPTAHVLLVDDIQTNLTVGAGLLRLCGIMSDVALSGREAIELVKSKDYDLVFMDHMMPEMDGIEAMEQIRNLGDKYKDLPIIALTANAVHESRDLLLASGMDDFLSKPIDKAELMVILQRWLPDDKIETAIKHIEAGQTVTYTDALDAASKIEGLDVELALSRISGMHDVLETSMEQTAYSIGGQLKKMDDHLTKGELGDFAIQAHGMKGSMANIGATQNSELAAELEIAAKAGDSQACIERFAVYASVMEGFATELKSVFPQIKSGDKTEGDPEFLELKLDEAISCLESFEVGDALESLNELDGFTFDTETDAALAGAKHVTEAFNYERAISELRRLKKG